MNLLLLLSALLSALTGVGASARVPERSQAVAAVSIARAATATARSRAASRPAHPIATLAAVAPIGLATPAIVRTAALWIDRRRE